ncbi:hypothetical protein [Streptomyces sp. WAC01280]|uniref:hypothetical protein n=1 Tax=Streptomyces sp. WAC01280 TaxID=2487424 RepID=UPI000F7A373F|nr:hypothetical protein [Streptomyces sp. WAC01280]RSS51257.1 hypothetical protein EF909_33655 [Streptomyces sp. WAC01280]
MIRNVVGSVLALAGATAAVWSPFRAWYDGRHGRDYAIDELFTGITDAKADVIGSILLPFAFAALLTVVGVVLRSRLLVALAGLVVLGFTVFWMVRVGQAEGSLVVSGDGRGLGDGVANAFGGGVLLLLGALVMSGRTRMHRVDRTDHEPRPTHPTLDGPPVGDLDDGQIGDGQIGDGPQRHPQASPPYAAPTQSYDVPTWDPDRDGPPPDKP